MEGLRIVYEAVLDIEVDDALAKCGPLINALDLIDSTGAAGAPAVFRSHWDDETRQFSQISPQLLPREVIAALAAVADGSMRRSDLIAVPPERGAPKSRPSHSTPTFSPRL